MSTETSTIGKKRVSQVFNGLGVWLVVVAMVIILSLVSPKFLLKDNLINLVRQISVTGIVALGATYIILAGEIDLSSGNMLALLGCTCATLMVRMAVPTFPALLITLVIGGIIGLVVGLAVTRLRVPSFIATLGIQYVLQGAVLLLTGSKPITDLPDSFLVIGRGYLFGIPVSTIIMIALFLIGAFVLKYMKFGRSVLAVGENPTAAHLSGINVKRIKVSVFIIGFTLSSLGGVVLASRLSSGQPTSGTDITLQALAAVYIGGSTKGSIMTTLAGALIIGMITNGLNLLEVNSYWQKVALGVIIVFAVASDMLRAAKADKA